MVQLIVLAILSFGITARAEYVQFEGYYRLELQKKPIGYVIQRYEIDEKAKKIRSTYFLKTGPLGGNIQESLKAEAKMSETREGKTSETGFEPISYQYTGKIGDTFKSIDATFRKERMEITRTETGKQPRKELYKIPAKTTLSTFAGHKLLLEGITVGKSTPYSAVAEEDGNSFNGSAKVVKEETFAGIPVYRIENKFRGESFISFVTHQGETVGTIVPQKDLVMVLVAKPEDATKGFEIPNKTIVLTFENIPAGKANALSRRVPSSDSTSGE